MLLEQHLAEGTLDLTVAALLAATSDRAGRDSALTLQEAGVWSFGEALPQQLLDQREVDQLMRA